MKKVFNNASDLIHVFAQQSQEEGRSSNVFFYGKKLYSYGYHYLLAEVFEHEGEQCIMINDKGYSNTTAKHIGWTISATRQYKQFFTTQCEANLVLNELNDLIDKLARANKPEKYILPAESLITKYLEYVNFVGVKDQKRHEEILAISKGFESQSSDLVEQKKAIIKAEKERKLNELKKSVNDFMTYETNRIYRSEEDYIRISQDGEQVETSQEIRIPIIEAKVLYQMIKNGKYIHGFNIGGYTVIGLNGVLKVGCHRINKQNMIEIGEQILQLS